MSQEESNRVRTRIAPSPTGMPHIGTVFQALVDFVIAKKCKGDFIIRIEDTDQSRKVAEAEEAIYDALEWVGINADESPKIGGKYGPYRQSERLQVYQKYARQLVEKDQAYYCFCSQQRLEEVRKKMQSEGKPPMYDKKCRSLSKEEAEKRRKTEKCVIRMKVPSNQVIEFKDEIRGRIKFESNLVDDQVILKSDGFPTYHLAVVVDDHLMKITHVVRGEEWISSTPKHALLYQYLEWKMPKIIHTPLLRNPDKSKLGKRHGHASVSWYQKQGYLPEAVINFLASRVWNHPQEKELFDLEELIRLFEVEQMHIQGPIVDLDKLDWYNGMYIRSLNAGELKQRLQKFGVSHFPEDLYDQVIPLVHERLVKLADFSDLTEYFWSPIEVDVKLLVKKSTEAEVALQLETTRAGLKEIEWKVDEIERAIRLLQEKNDWQKGQYFMMLRIAVTGRKASPPLFETMEVLGKEKVIERLKNAQSKCKE